jgi:lysophospholipase L1-like esterase
MTLRLLQAGQGAARPLVAAFGPMAAAKLPRILGPAACVVFDNDGHGTETMRQIVDFAGQQAGFSAVSGTALIGFSIGCSRVRVLRKGGAAAGAYLLVDGTHASQPPQPSQIDWLHELAEQARAGRILLVASHTYQTYVESLPKPYLASVTVLRLGTGFSLAQGGPATAPIVTKQPFTAPPSSGLWVYSYASKAADPEAHTYQGGPALHAMAAAHLAPWLAAGSLTSSTSTAAPRALLVGDSLAVGLAAPLRSRLRAAGGDLTGRGVNSTRIDDWAKGSALSEALTQARPALTMVSLGTNDLAAKPADYKRAWIGALVTRIRAAGSDVAWILPPSMPIADRGGTRAILAEELARLAVPAFDSQQLTIPRASDGIHPTPAGYDTWAAHLVQWLPSTRPAAPSPTWPTWGPPAAPTWPTWGAPAAPTPPAAEAPSTDTGAGTSALPPLMMLGLLATVLRS